MNIQDALEELYQKRLTRTEWQTRAEISIDALLAILKEYHVPPDDKIPTAEIVAAFNAICAEMRPTLRITPQLTRKIAKFWNGAKERRTTDWWRMYFNHVRQSDFLNGRRGDWKADLEFLVRPVTIGKIERGYYGLDPIGTSLTKTGKFSEQDAMRIEEDASNHA